MSTFFVHYSCSLTPHGSELAFLVGDGIEQRLFPPDFALLVRIERRARGRLGLQQ